MASRKLLLLLALVALAAAAALGGWRYLAGPSITTHVVKRGDLRQTVVATGRVESPRRVEIGSAVTGTVTEVPVREGEAVRAGQLLVRLDDAEALAALEQARSAVVQAEARLAQLRTTAAPVAAQAVRQAEVTAANAERALARSRDLHARGFVGEAALDEAQRGRDLAASQLESALLLQRSQAPGGSEVQLAHAAVEAARAALRLAQARLDHTTIEAPADGVLIARSVEKGAVVQPGRALMVLSPRGATQLVALVDEKNLPLVSLGQAAIASADAYPDARFEARVAYVNPAVDAVRGSVEVKLDVPSPPSFLLQDMTVSVDILAGTRSGVLTLPADALHPGDWVHVVRDGRIVRQPVKLGARGAGTVEVLDGLHEGESVVPAGRAAAREGARVRVAGAR